MAKRRSDRVAGGGSRTSAQDSGVNPFDLHFNKVKRNVVGRKLMRCEQGRPNHARHEAVEKRKKTLLQEYLNKDKTGKFKDKRLTDESGGLAARKAKIFDLKMKGVSEAQLTHQGHSLSSENLLTDRPLTDDFEEDVDLNLLKRADYVEAAHFGGGDDPSVAADGHRKSQSEYLEEVMNEKRKRQYEQEMTWSLTEKLDEEWKDVRPLMSHYIDLQNQKPSKASSPTEEAESSTAKQYDILMREMLFERKSAKSDVPSKSTSSSDAASVPVTRKEAKRHQQTVSMEQEQDKRRAAIQRIREKNLPILPLFEPRLESLTSKRDPLKKLQKKVKRELKGAQRELRKDSAFLKDVWLQEIKERDETRRKKVNRIIADLASDIHDARAIKKGS